MKVDFLLIRLLVDNIMENGSRILEHLLDGGLEMEMIIN